MFKIILTKNIKKHRTPAGPATNSPLTVSHVRRSQSSIFDAAVFNSVFVFPATGVSENDICSINIPSGIPFVYEFDNRMRVMTPRQFLGHKKRIEEGIARAASIGSH